MKKLDQKIQSEIEQLCDAGDSFAQKHNFSFALRSYWTAYDLLPEPKEEWLAGTWILTAIGDTNFLRKDYQAAIDNLSVALYFPSGKNNPFIHFRLGQSYYELGKFQEATKELLKAHTGDGETLFSNENPKYLRHIQSALLVEQLEWHW